MLLFTTFVFCDIRLDCHRKTFFGYLGPLKCYWNIAAPRQCFGNIWTALFQLVVNLSENEVSTRTDCAFNNFFDTNQKNKTLGTLFLCTCHQRLDAWYCVHIHLKHLKRLKSMNDKYTILQIPYVACFCHTQKRHCSFCHVRPHVSSFIIWQCNFWLLTSVMICNHLFSKKSKYWSLCYFLNRQLSLTILVTCGVKS